MPGHPLYEQNLADLPEREQKIEELAACKHVLHKMRAARTLFPPGHPLYEQKIEFSTEFLPLMQLKTYQYT